MTTNNQEQMPWYESAEKATEAAISNSGKPFKEVAIALRQDLKPESAYAWLKNCLNDRREKLTSDQHLFIAKYCDRFDWLFYNCAEAQFERPRRIKAEDQVIQLDIQIERQLEMTNRLLKRRNQLQEGQ